MTVADDPAIWFERNPAIAKSPTEMFYLPGNFVLNLVLNWMAFIKPGPFSWEKLFDPAIKKMRDRSIRCLHPIDVTARLSHTT